LSYVSSPFLFYFLLLWQFWFWFLVSGPVLAKQALYHLSHTLSPLVCFLMGITNIFTWTGVELQYSYLAGIYHNTFLFFGRAWFELKASCLLSGTIPLEPSLQFIFVVVVVVVLVSLEVESCKLFAWAGLEP
jgi:hypothetical protein